MGWKTLKKKFGIDHLIQVEDGHILIGSPYVRDIVTVNMETGNVSESSTFSGFLTKTYPELKEATPKEVLAAIKEEDTFEKSLKVYTYDKTGVVEKLCEEMSYPNVTHDGQMIYENTFFADRKDAVKAAQRNIKAEMLYLKGTVNRMKNEIKNYEKKIKELERRKLATK
jgi:hypothetical protein